MCRFALLVVFVTLLTVSIAQAGSYQKKDGSIVDPIEIRDLNYTIPDLQYS